MNISILRCAIAMAAIAMPELALAQQNEAEELAARFGARPSVLDISLSPSGSQIAYISSDNATTEILYVANLDGNSEPRALTTLGEPNSQLTRCDWASETWLVCEILGYARVDGTVPINFTRMLSVATEGSKANLLTSSRSARAFGVQQDGGSVLALDIGGEENSILMTRDFLPEVTVGTRLANEDRGLGVELVDVSNNRHRTVETADEIASRYVADENGVIRLKVRRPHDNFGNLTGDTEYLYRSPDATLWQTFGGDLENFNPVAVSAAQNAAYGFQKRNGYEALYRVALDGTASSEAVLSRDDVDVDGLIRIGRQQRVVGVTYATEKREIAYIDVDLANLAQRLQRALPGTPLISIADASADERSLLIIASSDVDPGMTYLLERDTNALSPLLPLRQALAEQPMAPMTPVQYPAGDGTMIPGYLTLPLNREGPVAAIVMPHGGPGARDEWGFDWMVQFLAARGYAVLQPNFRGSAGYGEAWFGRNGFQQWETAVGDVNDAGRWLVTQGIADPARLGVVGWSYGGYAALQSQVLDPDLYQAVIAIAPVTDLELLVEEARDYTNYQVVRRFVGEGPHVQAGSPANFAGKFRAPVLLFHGTADLNVSNYQSERMEQRLEAVGASVRYVEFEGLDHQLDDGNARTNMLLNIDQFLGEHLAD
jgi:dipeptidyl aminopeptidase/acylaminoacyl peptidase